MGKRLKEFDDLSDVFPSLIPINGKEPFEDGWQYWCENSRLFDSKEFQGLNAGIPCGPSNGILVIDVDEPKKFDATCKSKGWELPVTRRHQTGSGKPHIIYEYPKNGKRYGNRGLKNKYGFDIRGIGGQVVAPGSIHPDTGKAYKVLYELPIEPAPQWLLDIALQEPAQTTLQPPVASSETLNIESLQISFSIKNLIKNGTKKGDRSEAIASALSALVRAKASDQTIFQIFDDHKIGEKYREKGQSKAKWLQDEINRARGFNKGKTEKTQAMGATLSELKKEFGHGDKPEFLWKGAIPKHLPIMWAGREGHGKTTILLQAVKEILEDHNEGYIVWLSTEGTVVDTINKASVLKIESERFRIARKKDGSFKFNLERYDDQQQLNQILTELPSQTLVVIINSVGAGAFRISKNGQTTREIAWH